MADAVVEADPGDSPCPANRRGRRSAAGHHVDRGTADAAFVDGTLAMVCRWRGIAHPARPVDLGVAASACLLLWTLSGRLGATRNRPAGRTRFARPQRGPTFSHPSLERAASLSGTPFLRPGPAPDDARIPAHSQPGRYGHRRAAAVFP